jgi:hypothetical protein
MSRMGRWCSLVAVAGIPVAVGGMIVGQLGGDPRVDPFGLTIGEYVAVGGDGLTAPALGVLGVASAALVTGLRAVRAPLGSAVERLMLAWSSIMVAVAVVPMTAAWPLPAAAGNAPVPRYLSAVGFAALVAAGALLVSRLGADKRWRGTARPVEWLSLIGGFGVMALTYLALPGNGMLIGLVERVLLAVSAALLGVLAVRLARLTWAPALQAAHASDRQRIRSFITVSR